MNKITTVKHAILVTVLSLTIGCAKTASNATAVRGTDTVSDVTVSSKAISLQNMRGIANFAGLTSLLSDSNASEIKFCVHSIKLEDESGSAVTKNSSLENLQSNDDENENDEDKAEDDLTESEKLGGEIYFAPGLIDVSSGSEITWGNVKLPVGFNLSKIKVKIAKDKKLCGVDYALSYQGNTTEEELEFKWRFSSAVNLNSSTSQLKLSLDEIVTALRSLSAIGDFKEQLESIEEDNAEVE